MHEHQNSSALVIRRASPADVSTLSVVGSAAYGASYGPLWENSVALARHLASFSSDEFEKLLDRPDARLWVAQIDGLVVGFLTMIIGSANPITGTPRGAEIARIYLLPGSQRRRIGRQLLDSAVAEARREQLNHVWLEAISSAKYAKRAYLKWGFSELDISNLNKPVTAGVLDTVVLIKHLEL
ncbi:GNAT family N-acetyltransferase [Sinorhizobium meliloti]|uniref:GNAT family N-acetyltransferase n=1 Tax=Rhizobium meliloti TaxID=382 RepID=UPI000B4976B9|nr:GNAT family N-acetyltransferase [Sinorhizobium meliloti]ASP69726.1 N-acetyltransferase [Sinorhizobium meliloti]MQX00508.1 GNAT family N-acetyltransferase [Sinorhizobium meliloti]RVK38266.1 GNAT family N-acetyltransferase [Sinorhizobium meliloti]